MKKLINASSFYNQIPTIVAVNTTHQYVSKRSILTNEPDDPEEISNLGFMIH